MALAVFVPSTGFFFIYIHCPWQRLQAFSCFRPLHGVLLYLHVNAVALKNNENMVFVPSTGFFFIYYVTSEGYMGYISEEVFVPSTGFFFIYLTRSLNLTTTKIGFRPLHGVLLYLQWKILLMHRAYLVFVPSTGFFFIYNGLTKMKKKN